MRSLLLLGFGLVGCSSEPSFDLDKSGACEEDFVSWSGGLTWSLMQGDGRGAFDYDPPSGVENRLVGSYDLSTGDFAWDVSYLPAHWRESTSVTGFGYAAENGDLDIQGTITTEDQLDERWTYEFRYERVGCDVTEQLRDEDGALVVKTGRFEAGSFRYETEYSNAEDYLVTGYVYPDLTWSQAIEYDEGGSTYLAEEYGDSHGYSRNDWEQREATYEVEGYDETFVDGSSHRYYEYDGDDGSYTWDHEVDYSGDGTGTYSSGGYECDLYFEDWACTYDCGSGSTGSC